MIILCTSVLLKKVNKEEEQFKFIVCTLRCTNNLNLLGTEMYNVSHLTLKITKATA